MARKIKTADLFCGAGGSSTGAERALAALGLEMDLLCVNHWDIAIETHQRNHPKARHYCQDVNAVRPMEAVPGGRLDLLLASPTCTYHSRARGGKPTSDQQRMDPWHVVTWLTELRVKRLILENVPEFRDWAPVDMRTGRPIKTRKGEYFRNWLRAIEGLGFRLDHRIINCADLGDATTRQRFFLIGRSDGKPLEWPEQSHARMPRVDLLRPVLPKWRPAREIIDWGLQGRSIFNRKKPLSENTLARIWAGAVKFGWSEPYLVMLRNHMTAQGLDVPVPTITAGGTHIGIAQAIAFQVNQGNGRRRNIRGVDEAPLQTVMTRDSLGIAQPIMLPQGSSAPARSIEGPAPAVVCVSRIGLVEPFILANRTGNSPKSLDEPVPPIVTSGGVGLVEPFILSRQGGGAPRSIDEPTPGQTARHSHILVEPSEPLISPYYSAGSGKSCHPVSRPLPTVTSKGRFGMVLPITHSGDSNRARDVEETPLPTITGANRGELAFITAQFGEREGQAPRVRSIEDPAPTVCATGHVNLVVPGEHYDILFRMLEPHELAAAMGFSDSERSYEFAGTKTEKIKQIGNAVPVNTAAALVKALCRDAAVKKNVVKIRKRRAA